MLRLLVVVALVALVGVHQAHAQMVLGTDGDVDAGPSSLYDPCPADAGEVVDLRIPTDGGIAMPAVICRGQRAPTSGVLLTVDRAALIAGKCDEDHVAREQLETELKQAQTEADFNRPTVPPWAWVVTCAAAGVVTGYCATHDCNPLDLGKKK